MGGHAEPASITRCNYSENIVFYSFCGVDLSQLSLLYYKADFVHKISFGLVYFGLIVVLDSS